MSLVSASKLVGGLKEYGYRGFQQLPLVIGSTSMLFTIATGSIAHANILIGMGALIPMYTFTMQLLIGRLMTYFFPGSIFWKRISSDSCNIIPDFSESNHLKFGYEVGNKESDGSVPSYWLMQMAFFIGYSISNAVDSLLTPEAPGANDINYEKRNYQAITVITTCVIFSILILMARFSLMPGCDGASGAGILGFLLALFSIIFIIILCFIPTFISISVVILISFIVVGTIFSSRGSEFSKSSILVLAGSSGLFLSMISALGASGIGYGMYSFSRKCGARSSDLFGILSQILPPSSMSPQPVVCTAENT